MYSIIITDYNKLGTNQAILFPKMYKFEKDYIFLKTMTIFLRQILIVSSNVATLTKQYMPLSIT